MIKEMFTVLNESEVLTAVTMNNTFYWDIETQFVPHRKKNYISATEPSRLILCEITGFHGDAYEE
jgi:hypothetical protein